MNNTYIEYEGYKASVHVSLEDKCLYGKVEDIGTDSFVFGADTGEELVETFHKEIEDYLELKMLLDILIVFMKN